MVNFRGQKSLIFDNVAPCYLACCCNCGLCRGAKYYKKLREKGNLDIKKRKLLDVDAQKHQLFLRTKRLPVHGEWMHEIQILDSKLGWMHEIQILLQGEGVFQQKHK